RRERLRLWLSFFPGTCARGCRRNWLAFDYLARAARRFNFFWRSPCVTQRQLLCVVVGFGFGFFSHGLRVRAAAGGIRHRRVVERLRCATATAKIFIGRHVRAAFATK